MFENLDPAVPPAAPHSPPPAPPAAAGPPDSGAQTPTAAAAWKTALRQDFERWLAGLDPEPAGEQADPANLEAPDLYAFYEQLASANNEARRANRRTAEAISQWGATLAQFEGSLAPLRETVAQLVEQQPQPDELSREHCLALVELMDRLERIARAFDAPPRRTGWFAPAAAWPKAWQAQRQAFTIVLSHLEALLAREGVVRLEALGQPFDPLVMTAVAVESDPARPPQTVIEELAAGYERYEELLRPAQVKVTTRPGT
jgi:molecular chaperone GrpE